MCVCVCKPPKDHAAQPLPGPSTHPELRTLLTPRPGPAAVQAAHLKDYTARCPHVAKLASIGKSVGGSDLWVLELGDRSPVDVDRPAFRYLANMHGDEPTGRWGVFSPPSFTGT